MSKSSNSAKFQSSNQPNKPASPLNSQNITMPAVDPDTAKKIIEGRSIPATWQPPAVHSLAAGLIQGAPSIIELTRALRNDPSLIYEFVYNNIEHSVGMGQAKGALGTLLDGCGNSFDQCSLLAALLRQAGFTANYEVGQIQLNLTQLNAWLGTTDATNIYTPYYVLSNAGVPVTITGTYPNQLLVFSHCWLKVNIGTLASPNWVVMDPAYKTYTTKSAINLATATGYSQATFLSQARSGYTIDSSGNWVQNVNRANTRTQLQNLSMNLINWIKANNPGAGLDDIVGGRQIVPVVAPITFATSLPYQVAGNVPTEFTADFSTAYKTTVQLQYPGLNVTLTSDQLAGHRLTFFFSASGSNWVPTLALDGVTIATGTAQGSGSYNSMLVTVAHNAYPTTYSNQSFYQTVLAPNQGGATGKNYYLIGSAFGPTGKGTFDYHTALQTQNEFNAGGFTYNLVAEPALGERLAAQFAAYQAQVTQVGDIINRLTGTLFTNHHTVGMAFYQVYGSPTISAFDIQGVIGSSSVLSSANTVVPAGIANGMHGYALEMLALQQLTGQHGVSTTRDLDVANNNGLKIYKGTQANWNTSVLPNLTGYSAGDLSNISTYYLPYNWDVLLAESAGQSYDSHWTLTGYSLISTYGGAIGLIYANYAGGGATGAGPGTPPPKNDDKEKDDPVNSRTGDFLYRNEDLSLGSGEDPYKLSFQTSYDSRKRLVNGPLGLGWTHNWAINTKVGSNGFIALGSQSAIKAAASIVELFVVLDLLADTTLPVDKLVIVHICDQWWVDQLSNNIVTVSMPDFRDLEYVLLPDGSYASPLRDASVLSIAAGAYTLTTPQKLKYNFNVSGQLATVVFPNGMTITLTYTSGKLTSITNGLGRTLTLNYTGNFITSVTDGTGRSVSYTIDGSNQLTKFTDALSQAYTFAYVSAGLMSKYFKPQNPTNAVVTNTFDSLKRVSSQLTITGTTQTYYLAGSRSEFVDAAGNHSVTYFDSQYNAVKETDALAYSTRYLFDSLGRLVRKTLPEGNYTTFTYDLFNNVLTETKVAKSGSGIANIVLTNTWDANWNKIKTAKDGNGNITTFGYDATLGNLLTIQRPAVSGLIPLVTNKWNTRGQLISTIDETGIQTQYTYDTSTEKLLSKIINTNWSCVVGGTVTVGNVLTITIHDTALSGGVKSDSYTVVAGDTLAKIATGLANVINADAALAALGIKAYVNGAVLSLSTSPGNSTTFTGSTSVGATETLTFAAGKNLTTSYGYDSVGNTNAVTDPNAYQVTFLFDALRRLTQRTEPAPFSYVTKYGYDANSNQLNVQRQTGGTPAFQTYAITYTLSDKPKTYVDPASNTTTIGYDSYDRPQTVTDAQTRKWTIAYDALNRQSQMTDPNNIVTNIRTYTPNGLIASVKDAAGNQTQYTFDGFDRPNKTIYADTTFEQNSVYDANGNVLTRLTRSGSSIVQTFDVLNRLSTKAPTGQPTVTNQYDLAGRLIQASKPTVAGDPSSGALKFSFDSAGRFYQEQYPDGKTVTHVLDNNGNQTKTTYPDGYYVSRTFDQMNRLTNIKLNGSSTNAVVFSYNQLSQRTQLTFSNGTTIVYTPQLNEDVTGVTHNFVGSSVAFTYGFNLVHEPTTQSVSDNTYMWHPGSASSVSYGTADNVNKYPSVSGTSYSYDGNKNLTGDGTWTYSYDTENHLLTASKTGTSAALVYDPVHRQSQKAVTTSGTVKTRYVYSGWQRIADYDGTSGSLQNRYVYGTGIDEPLIIVSSTGVLTFLHHDRMGSIIAVSNASGAVANKNLYGPFGEITTLAGTSFGFQGQRYDSELGLYYFKRRYYSPKIGRFLQPDPIGYSDFDLNLYSFAMNSPQVFSDPMGELIQFTPPGAAAVGFILLILVVVVIIVFIINGCNRRIESQRFIYTKQTTRQPQEGTNAQGQPYTPPYDH